MLQTIGYIIFGILFVYLAAGIVYLFILAFAGLVRKNKRYAPAANKNRVAVFIPSYKEDLVILDTAMRAASHDYPKDKFDVFVIADKLQEATIQKLQSIPVNVVRVQFETSTKAKSLNVALQQASDKGYEYAMILDADNVMGNGCLEQVNAAFEAGCAAVQCHRTAKNKHTAVAVLDAISEEINNHLFRKAPRALNVSVNLIGSGMAFRYNDLKEIMALPHILDNPGEDREIDLQLMKRNIITEYLDDAIVLDEKVSSAQVFEKQRVRWLEAQVTHFKRFLQPDMKSAPRNANYFHKFIQTLLLPRSLYILVLGFMAVLLLAQWIFNISFVYPLPAVWIGAMVLFALSLVLCIPASFYNSGTLKAILHIPVLILSMVKALLQMKKNRTSYIHTPKTFTGN